MLWEPWVIRSLSKDFQKERLIKKYCFERWATRSLLEVATAAGGSWPKRRFFEEERFISKCTFGALSDQELFGTVRAAWGCLGRAVALWDVLERCGALWGAVGRSGALWVRWRVLGRCGALWGGRSGALWGALGYSGVLWGAVGRPEVFDKVTT